MVLQTLWEHSAVVAAPASTSLANRNSPLRALGGPAKDNRRYLSGLFSSSTESFGQDHINFVSSVAAITAVALESVLAMESLRAENRQLRQKIGEPASP